MGHALQFIDEGAASFWGELRRGLLDESEVSKDPFVDVGWREWLARVYPDMTPAPFGEHHVAAWEHAWSIRRDTRPDELILAWPRKGGKTSTVQLIVAATIIRETRGFWLYVCETQPQAEEKLQNISALLGRGSVQAYYPQHADRAVNKYNTSLGWSKQRLRTRGGGIVEAVGLNNAMRGLMIEGQPPDGVILDDIDGRHDSTATTTKKEQTIRSTILPAATSNAAVIVAQNLIIPHGVVSRLVNNKADYMQKRKTLGPLAAVEGLETGKEWDAEHERFRDVITGGTPIWAGQDLEACQAYVDTYGLSTFIEECQNIVDEKAGALWTKALLNECRRGTDDLPLVDGVITFKRLVIGVDPSGGGDEIGIIVAALGHNGHVYVLADLTQPGSKGVNNWAKTAVDAYDEWQADCIVAESNFGGNMVEAVIRAQTIGQNRHIPVKLVTASRGKALRAEPVVTLYEDGLMHHVGTLPELEVEQTTWEPGVTKASPNRLDACVWVGTELLVRKRVHTGGAGSIQVPR